MPRERDKQKKERDGVAPPADARGSEKSLPRREPAQANDSEKSLLKREPTAERWQAEILRVLNGERESDLINLESVEEYVDKILDLSSDKVRAKMSFDEALRRVVQTWQPVRRETKEYLACLLDLIGAYTPPNAAPKMLAFLNRWGRFESDLESSWGYGSHHDLNLKALVVLGNCVDAARQADAEDARVFRQYAGLLREKLADDEYGGHAATRLIELSLITVEDQEIGSLVKRNPPALRSLVSLVFSRARRSRLEKDLGGLFVHAVDAGGKAFKAFEQTLENWRASFEFRHQSVVFDIRGRPKVEIPLSHATRQKYLDLISRREMRLDELQELLTEAPKHPKARAEVTRILETCIDKYGGEGAQLFKNEILKHDARIVEFPEERPQVKLRDGTHIRLALPPRSFQRYVLESRWRLDKKKDAMTEVREIMKSKAVTSNGG